MKKKLHTLDMNSGPLRKWLVFCHWTTKARYQKLPQINISSIRNYQGLSFRSLTGFADLFPQHDQFFGYIMYLALMVQCQNTCI
jgi:hypothetical protein